MRQSAYKELFEAEDRHWWFRGRRAVVDALISHADLPATPLILDAGCGTGGNLGHYAAIGSVTGVEPSADAVGFCRERGFDVAQAGLESVPFEDGRFDLVIATDVVEHIAAEQAALRELLRIAKPGGTMILTVPAYQWLWSEEDERLHHQRRYTRRRLEDAVRRAGWQPILATYFNSILLAPIAAARSLPRRGGTERSDLSRTPAALNGPLSIPMRLEARAIQRGVRFPAGVSVGIVCRRVAGPQVG